MPTPASRTAPPSPAPLPTRNGGWYKGKNSHLGSNLPRRYIIPYSTRREKVRTTGPRCKPGPRGLTTAKGAKLTLRRDRAENLPASGDGPFRVASPGHSGGTPAPKKSAHPVFRSSTAKVIDRQGKVKDVPPQSEEHPEDRCGRRLLACPPSPSQRAFGVATAHRGETGFPRASRPATFGRGMRAALGVISSGFVFVSEACDFGLSTVPAGNGST